MDKREKGPIEILCKEIDFRFDKRMESKEVFIAFVTVLVVQVARIRYMQHQLSGVTNVKPSEKSKDILVRINDMLHEPDADVMVEKAAAIHNHLHSIGTEEEYPCDHLVDMLSSCVSAIRFGLEKPCKSRHAASAADHIWKHVYGISLFDSFTSNWRNDWSRAQLQEAILNMSVCEHERKADV